MTWQGWIAVGTLAVIGLSMLATYQVLHEPKGDPPRKG